MENDTLMTSDGCTITKYIEDDKTLVEMYGRIWFHFIDKSGAIDGASCAASLKTYLSATAYHEAKQKWNEFLI
jgi:hypothetical protein